MYVPCTDWSGNETDLLLLNCKRASLKAFFDTAVGPEDAFDMSPIGMEELNSVVRLSAFTCYYFLHLQHDNVFFWLHQLFG